MTLAFIFLYRRTHTRAAVRAFLRYLVGDFAKWKLRFWWRTRRLEATSCRVKPEMGVLAHFPLVVEPSIKQNLPLQISKNAPYCRPRMLVLGML